MKKAVLTMPIKPYYNFSLGKMSTPILAESLAKKLGAEFYLVVNMLDSYNTREFAPYKTLLENYQIMPDYYWIDSEHKDELISKIYLLIQKGYVYETMKKVVSCNCKKVEICYDSIEFINQKDSCFEEKNGKYYCKHCQHECFIEYQKVLVFNPANIDKNSLLFYPKFITNDVKTFSNGVAQKEIIISRRRNTGVELLHNQTLYSIDIDFLWELYLSLFEEEEKIVLCSNHQLYQLYMVLLLEKCFDNNTTTIGLATPHVNMHGSELEQSLEQRILSFKLWELLNFRWNVKENKIDYGLISYLNSMNVTKKQQLYEIIMQEDSETISVDNLDKILHKDFNFQNSTRKLKKERKNV